MRILIVGSGGREHALTWKLAQSPSKPRLFIAPGNAGTAGLGMNINIEATDVDGLVRFAAKEKIDITVVGPEQPLVAGIVDAFEEAGLPIIGPSAAAARLEGSKAWAKAFMERYEIPTAHHRTFSAEEYEQARAYIDERGAPIVIKASGLAAGKGAIVCETVEDAHEALHKIVEDRAFGEAGDEVVIEEFMQGDEASVFALTDGDHYVVTVPARDHKPVGEGDTGPNTGGMGAYAPAPIVTGSILTQVCREIIEPVLAGMKHEGHPYRGILYCGLMITSEGRARVVEFNCRLGDPEAQVVLPLLENDLAEVFQKLVDGRLREVSLSMGQRAAACVVMASGGYPTAYEKGFPITGIGDAEALEDVTVFHAGTSRNQGSELITAGGRVLGVTATAINLESAIERAYDGVERIHFEEAYYRRDIGHKGLQLLKG